MAGTTYVWTSATSGDWWSGPWNIPGAIPDSATAIVDLSVTGSPFTVTLHDGTITTTGGSSESFTGYEVGTLKLGTSATLLLQTSDLIIAAGAANSGTITADYALQVGNTTPNVVVNFTSLTGALGHIVLNGATGATLSGHAAGIELDLHGNSIEGSGSVSNLHLKIYDDARINANVAGQTLSLNTGYDILNNGVIGATNGGTLTITGSAIGQAPYANGNLSGFISASDKSVVVLSSDRVVGGSISESGSGVVQAGDSNDILDGSTSSGHVTLVNGFSTAGYDLTIRGYISNQGVLSAAGTTIYVDSNTSGWFNSAGSATKGQVKLASAALNSTAQTAASASLDNVDNQIVGYGAIYNLVFTNEVGGVVNANVAGGTLDISGSNTVKNKGLLEATNGGRLNLYSQTFDSALGGSVTASGANSVVALATTTFLGGTLAVGSGGKFLLQDSNVLFDGSTASGAITLAQSFDTTGYNLNLKGTLHNKGTVSLSGVTLEIDAAGVTLDSGGAATKGRIALTGASINSLTNTAQGSTLDNIDNQIVGYGALYNLAFTNEKGAVVNANVAGGTLDISGSNTVTNKGLLEATAGGRLDLYSQTVDSALGGSITAAGANSVVALATTTFLGGSLIATLGGKFLLQYSNVLLDGSTASGAVTLAQSLDTTGYNLNLKGTLHSKGTISLSGVTLEIDAAGATLDSGGAAAKGRVALTGANINSLTNMAQGSTLDNVDNQIVGYGALYNLVFTNEAGGVVNANVVGGTLDISGSTTVINKGLLEATAGGRLDLYSQTVDAALGGSITASGANSVVALATTTFMGGTLAVGLGGKFLLQDSNVLFDGSTASGAVTLAQSLDTTGYNLNLKGTLHNKGTISLSGVTLEIDAAGATLDSGGAAAKGRVALTGANINSLTNMAQGSTLDNVDNQIIGYGALYNLKFTNEAGGLVNANVAGQTLSIDSSDSVTNKGLLVATTGVLNLSGGYYFNAGGTIWANNGTVNLSSMVVRQGTLRTTGTSKIVIADNNVSIDSGTVTNGLVLSGDIQVNDGLTLSMSGSVLDNAHIYLGDANGASSLYLGATLNGVGSIVMAANQASVISGAFYNVRSTIVGAGLISAVVQQGGLGVIDATGALTLNSGHAITNFGRLEAVGGVLTVADAVTGSGGALVSGGGTLSFASTFNENTTFSGAGRLVLAQAYSGVLSGFAAGARLDLTNIAYSAGEHMVWRNTSAGVQTFSLETAANVVLESLHFRGDYSPSFFVVTNNGGSAELALRHAPLSPVATNTFNNDFTSDILWTGVGNSTIQTWTMLKGAKSTSNTGPALTSGYALAGTGDFGGDGVADLLLYNSTSGAVQEWDMVNGVYSKAHSLGSVAPLTGWGIAGVGDFNGDGNADILWVNNSTQQTMVWEERNNALVGKTTMAGPGANWNVIGTGDFNADGVTDVLWENASTKSVLDWQMSGGAVQSTSVLGTVASGSTFQGVGDFDGKGADEVLFQTSTGALSAWQIVNGANVGTLSLASGVPNGFTVAKVGDFNGDGVSDVLLYTASTGGVDVGLVSGGTIASWAAVGTQAAANWRLSA